MASPALGGMLKVALALLLGWAWLTGRLEQLTGEVLAMFGGQAAAVGNRMLPDSSRSSSSDGQVIA